MTARTLQTGRTVRILADDLTGALDSATAFIGLPSVAGVPVVLDAAGPWPDAAARVAAVSTGSRDAPLADLPGLLDAAWVWLGSADIAFKKVDSLLRGNTFDEVRLAARSGHFDRVVFAPAFPQQGRLTVGGRLHLGGATGEPTPGPTLAERLGDLGLPLDL
ncbi:MAG TPA: four-carbon acid sugar kinase family protein, partial [Burkholderiaceae bacterium]|nr:four-carbon acid sugar kinase family protein [Burkholderiaceae bacterium]